jgi:hypothetical protein
MLRPLIIGDADRERLRAIIPNLGSFDDFAFGKIVDEVERIAEAHAEAALAQQAQPEMPSQSQYDAFTDVFLAGAKWWEFESTGATMWPSDQSKVIAEAERRIEAAKML